MTSSIPETQKKMLSVTGTATSPDGLITVTVGPRGQLVDLEIDPKIYRRPDSALLAQNILKTVRDAVEQVQAETSKLVGELLPKELSADDIAARGGVMSQVVGKHDADVLKLPELGDG